MWITTEKFDFVWVSNWAVTLLHCYPLTLIGHIRCGDNFKRSRKIKQFFRANNGVKLCSGYTHNKSMVVLIDICSDIIRKFSSTSLQCQLQSTENLVVKSYDTHEPNLWYHDFLRLKSKLPFPIPQKMLDSNSSEVSQYVALCYVHVISQSAL